jgi:hypothetical protein
MMTQGRTNLVLTKSHRIQFLLFAWIVHRTYRELNAKSSASTAASSSRQPKRRAHASAVYALSDSDACTESDNDGNDSFYPAPRKSGPSVALGYAARGLSTLKRHHPNDDHSTQRQSTRDALHNTPDALTHASDNRTIKRRHTSTPGNPDGKDTAQATPEKQLVAESARSGLLQRFQPGTTAYRADATDTPSATHQQSPMVHHGDNSIETVHRPRDLSRQPDREEDQSHPSQSIDALPPPPSQAAEKNESVVVEVPGSAEDASHGGHHSISTQASSAGTQSRPPVIGNPTLPVSAGTYMLWA